MNKAEFKSKELAKQAREQISEKLFLLKKELFNLRFQQTLGELKNTSRFSLVRKNIARIKTEIAKRSKIGD